MGLPALYPVLFASTRILYIAAHNPGQFTLGDLVLVLLATSIGIVLLQTSISLLIRNRLESRLSGLITFLLLAWTFGVPPIEEWIKDRRIDVSGESVVIAAVLASVSLIYGLARRPVALRAGAKFLTITYGMLVVYLGMTVASAAIRAEKHVAESVIAAELAEPPAAANAPVFPLRDIYVIVLDEYANAAVLREVLKFDNRSFEDSLKSLGFHVPRWVSSNYALTSLSLPSLLNAAHMQRLQEELPPGSTDPTLPNHLLAHSRIPRYLQRLGYRFVFYPSSWWISTRSSPTADSIVDVWPDGGWSRELSRTELRRVVRKNTITWRFYRDAAGDAEIELRTLQEMRRLPSVEGNVFAFAHLLSPHPPHVFDQACRTIAPEWRRHPAAYLNELQCLNQQILETVSALIQHSSVAPIIILQGDHGPAFRRYFDIPTVTQVPDRAITERLGAFGAYYLPEDGAASFGDTVTVVNVLGHVLRHYLGASFESEPNQHFISLDAAPFDFRPVDPVAIRQIGSAIQPR